MAKTVLITGANGGLGQAVVQAFLEAGYRVIAANHSENRNTAAGSNPLFEHHVVNLGDESETGDFIATMISKHQQLHAALLLVGGFAMGDIADTDGQALQQLYSVNFETAYFSARPLFTHMQQQGYGRIVLIGARPALQAAAGKQAVAYALSKSLLFTLADLLNATAKGTNVVTSVVAPSTIDTPANRKSMPDADFDKWVKTREIAELLAFICSDEGNALRDPVYKIYGQA
ncbi:MAG: SDR family NAD(P)-dependent oxidoreductase [Candidatus Pseudobacter hemicellulosilyticus]|uniref:SDR family NAD(P)-dependent oxidoreductase n=1 Tax=Candidatus Pseudobacter hemicellulosilyticus TaxID=3121375 RepID=A0AAJ6BHH7_9BACT|nr:MAG: SDR family NAD(P)-dependent oxidoreductase [Pseudobacter sp.]